MNNAVIRNSTEIFVENTKKDRLVEKETERFSVFQKIRGRKRQYERRNSRDLCLHKSEEGKDRMEW